MKQHTKNRQGYPLRLRLNEVENTRAWVLLMHGIGDHSGRYDHVAQHLNDRGISVLRYDLQGHGDSGGTVAYVDRFEDHIADFAQITGRVREMAGERPLFVLAHSMGALIAAHFILDHREAYAGAIFAGGLFKVNEDISPFLQKISGIMSRLFPRLKTVKLDYTLLSRDPAVLETSARDPLHYKGGIRARMGAEMLEATRAIEARLTDWTLPVLLLHGGADQLTKPEASQNLYDLAPASDKTLKIYPGAYHELLHEINREEILNDICYWIETRSGEDI